MHDDMMVKYRVVWIQDTGEVKRLYPYLRKAWSISYPFYQPKNNTYKELISNRHAEVCV